MDEEIKQYVVWLRKSKNLYVRNTTIKGAIYGPLKEARRFTNKKDAKQVAKIHNGDVMIETSFLSYLGTDS